MTNTNGDLTFTGGTVGTVNNTAGTVTLGAAADAVTNADNLIITTTGSVIGDVTTQAPSTSDINGGIGGNLVSEGGVTLSADVGGRIDNLGGATLTIDGDTSANGVFQFGDLLVLSGTTLTSDVQTQSGSTTTVNGTIDGAVTNVGDFTGTGRTVGLLLNNGGTLTFDGVFAADGGITNAGVLTQSAASVLTGDITNSAAGVANVDGRIVGSLSNAGDLALSGDVTGDLGNTGGGVLTVDGDVLVDGTVTNAATFTIASGSLGTTGTDPLLLSQTGTFTLANGTSIDMNGGEFVNDGTLTSTGAIIGELVQNGTAAIEGVVQGDVTTAAASVTTVTGDLTFVALSNAGTIDLTTGTTTVSAASNAGTMTIANAATLTGQAVLQSGTNSALVIAGLANSDVTARGALAVTGRVAGDLNTQGTADLAGTIGGLLTNSGTADVTADLDVTGAVATSGTLMIGNGTTLTAAAGTTNTGTLNVDGILVGDLASDDTATIAGTLTGDLTNAGTVGISGTVTGDLDTVGVATLDGVLTGDLTNGGTAGVNGTVDGAVENSGALTLAGEIGGTLNGAAGSMTNVVGLSRVTGAVTDAGALNVATAGDLRAAAGVAIAGTSNVAGIVTANVTVAATGDLDVANGGSVAGNLANGGAADVAGTVSGDVANTGTFGLADTGRLAGTLANSGTARIAGLVTGIVTNTGDLTVAQGGAVTARVANTPTGTAQIAGTIGGLDAVGGDIEITQTGLVAGTTTIGAAASVVTEGGTFGADVVNAGTFGITGDSQIAGDLTNNGSIDGTTASGDLDLTVSGTFINNDRVFNTGTDGEFNLTAGTIVLGSSSVVQGAVNLIGATQNNGTILYDRDSTQNGMLRNGTDGNVVVSADIDFQGNILDNDGVVGVETNGSLSNISSIVNSGIFGIAEGGSVQAALTTNQSGGTLTNSGTLTTNLVNNAGATATSTGTLVGNVTNDDGGTLTLGGIVDGNVVNNGQLTGGAQISGILQTTQTGVTQIDADMAAAQSQIIGGTVAVAQTGTLTTVNGLNVSAAGSLVSQGVINSDVTVSDDSQITSSGMIVGRLVNNGDADLAGTINGALVNTASGDVQVTGDLTAQFVENAGSATISAGTTLTTAGGITSEGTLSVAGQVVGDLVSSAGSSLEIAGRVTGDVTTQGATDLGGVIDGSLASTGTSVTASTVASAITGTADFVDSDVVVANGTNLAFGGAATLDAASTLAAQGTVAGDVTSAGAVTLAQGIDGSLTSGGAAVIAGTVSDNLTITGGTLDLQGDVTIGDTFSTVRDLDVAAGQTITASRFLFSGNTLNLEGNLDAITTLGAAGMSAGDTVLNLASGGRLSGLRSFGTLRTAGDAQVDGDFQNNGIIDLTGNAQTGDTLTINGNMTGDAALFVDVDLGTSTGSSDHQADTLVVNGIATGHFDVRLNVVSLAIGEQENDIVILDVDRTQASDSGYTFALTNASEIPVSERIVYSLARNSDADSLNFGDLVLVDQVNPAIGALAGNVSLSQSLIGSVVNRPTSPFVVPAATGDACGAGAWSRVTGGRATASGNTSGSLSQLRSEIEATYQGLQIGGDFGCYQGAFNGWDLSFGALGGYNKGSGTQPVFAIDPTDPTRLTGSQTSVTESDFDQIYGGFYAIAAKDRLSLDLQLNVGKTDFVLNNRAIGTATSGLGLTDTEFDIRTTTLSGALSYGFDLPTEGFSITPTMGFALSRSKTSTVVFDDGATLEVDDSDTQVGFVGATLSKVKIAESGQSALAYFGTATAYNDFSDGLASTFTLPGGVGENDLVETLTSENLGFYSEFSFGVNYTRILSTNEKGLPLRQFSASARTDFRLSDTLDSAAITAQIRF